MMSPELLQNILFFVFSAVTIASALAVVSMKNSVYSALFLVLTFFTMAVLWLLLEAEFLAITLVLVYVGAVMVLFLFVVMMLDVKTPKAGQLKQSYTQGAILIAAAMLIELLMLLAYKMGGELPADVLQRHPEGYSNVKEVANSLFTQYVYPFEIAAVILLVAIVAAILLTLRRRPENKQIDPSRQIHVNPADRIRLVDMPARKGNGEEQ